jgi:hypothetical protein
MNWGKKTIIQLELHYLYTSPCIVRAVKSWRFQWCEQEAKIKLEMNTEFWYGNPWKVVNGKTEKEEMII